MLKLQHSGHLIQRDDSLDEILILGRMEGKRRRGRRRMRWLDNLTDSMGKNMNILQEMVKGRKPGMLQSMRSPRVSHTRLSDWTTIFCFQFFKWKIRITRMNILIRFNIGAWRWHVIKKNTWALQLGITGLKPQLWHIRYI